MVDGDDWQSWLRRWKPEMTRHGKRGARGYQYQFAQNVLVHVPGLKPSEVTPEHPFVDGDGRQRYMDFAIIRGGQKIAIEVDGWDKTGSGSGMSPDEHEDYLMRERSLTGQGWTVLRFANREIYKTSRTNAMAIQLAALLNESVDADRDATGVQKLVIEVVQQAATETTAEPPSPTAEATASEAPSSTADITTRTAGPSEPEPKSKGRTTALIAGVVLVLALVLVVVLLILALGGDDNNPGVAPLATGDCPASAPIKGNVNIEGEKIFHVPGGEFFERTDPEECFAATADAIAAGYRASQR